MSEFSIHRNRSIENNKKETNDRRRCILHLILKYLDEQNLSKSASFLRTETHLTGNEYQICDNIDLEIVLQEFQSYYHLKYQKIPEILKKCQENVKNLPKKLNTVSRSQTGGSQKSKQIESSNDAENFHFEIVNFTKNDEIPVVEKLSQISCTFEGDSKLFADEILGQIVPNNLNVLWEDCIGLGGIVEIIKEATVYPYIYPDLFKKIKPWRSVLLFGPPGTGKTLLAKALACETPMVTFNVSSSTFTSKWRGESEKMIKILFEMARSHASSTIFIDEIDSLTTQNTNSTSNSENHEASRRFRAELLTQIDGVSGDNNGVFLLATTNTPWHLDWALLRRFDKRIFVPLPDIRTRSAIYEYTLRNSGVFTKTATGDSGEIFERAGAESNRFSGADIKLVCREVEMCRVREKIKERKYGRKNSQMSSSDVDLGELILRTVNKIKPCLDDCTYRKYCDWNLKFGTQLTIDK